MRSSVHPDDLQVRSTSFVTHCRCTLRLRQIASPPIKVEAPPWMRRRTMKLEHWREYASRTETYRVEEITSRDLKEGVA